MYRTRAACILFTQFFTAVYIAEWLVIYVLNKEILQFLSLKSPFYNQENFTFYTSPKQNYLIAIFGFSFCPPLYETLFRNYLIHYFFIFLEQILPPLYPRS